MYTKYWMLYIYGVKCMIIYITLGTCGIQLYISPDLDMYTCLENDVVRISH